MKKEHINPYLSGIKKIEIAPIHTIEIKSYELLKNGVPVLVDGNFEELCIEGIAGVETKKVKENGQNIYTVVLKFRAESDIALSRVVFRLTTVLGEQYLLGTHQMPLASIQEVAKNIALPTGANLSEYEVTYINTHGLLTIAENGIEKAIKVLPQLEGRVKKVMGGHDRTIQGVQALGNIATQFGISAKELGKVFENTNKKVDEKE